jgi:hypothetical protein
VRKRSADTIAHSEAIGKLGATIVTCATPHFPTNVD